MGKNMYYKDSKNVNPWLAWSLIGIEVAVILAIAFFII